ncbi:hypothetical protein BKA56DRAFT_313924 [Ilyonectria sp. MPI-CAGE-AT-0026]|nr:hypothetical protein BKA56DRAFT_313924 [Ilyonectria sp. MPI-CAGE-AT-0026]
MRLKYLISGATGNMGGGILSYFLRNNVPEELYAVTSSSQHNRQAFESLGVQFRHLDYNSQQSIETALDGVENFFFVASNLMNHEQKCTQHRRVIDAAEKMHVGHIWYTSLAFGGYRSDSKVTIYQAHLETERMLQESGLNYTVIKEAIYAETWWMLMGYDRNSKSILIPAKDGQVTMTPRDELVEANAQLLLRCDEFKDKRVILPTGPKAYTWTEMVEAMNEVTGKGVEIKRVTADEYIRGRGGLFGRLNPHLRAQLSWFIGIANGDLATVEPIMESILGRKPTDFLAYIKTSLQEGQGRETVRDEL